MALDRRRLREALRSSIVGLGAFTLLPRRARIRAIAVVFGLGVLVGALHAVLSEALGGGTTAHVLLLLGYALLFFFVYDVALAYVLLERRDRDGELAAATRIQQALFPAVLPRHPDWSCATHHVAAAGVGGDYHDILPLSGDRWLVVVADVAGKGMPAAILMAGLRTRLRTLCETLNDPAALAARLNHGMVIDTRPSEYATLFLALADPAAGTLTWVDAGHQPGLIVRADGTFVRLDGDDLPVGMFDEVAYTAHTVAIGPGDRLILFTDGVVEAAIGRDRELTPEDVADAVARCPDRSAAGAVAAVRDLVERATGGEPADDDLTLVAVQF